MHRIMTALLLSAAIVQASVAHASAADMAIPPSPPESNPGPIFYVPPAFSWTGFYVGGNVGWDWTNITDAVTTTSGAAGSLSGNVGSVLGGGQIGYNWQVIQPVVIGLEADLQAAQATNGSRSVNGVVGSTTITGLATTPYFGTVRGRVGYAYGMLLFYGTAGAAYGDARLRGVLSPGGIFSTSANFWSWTAGAGVEAALGGPYSVKLEYLFIGSPSSWPLIPGETGQTVSLGTSLIRAGVNYRF
jgi:outer membrane immunogenic protein